MAQEYSPFTPGQPVPVEFFTGRVNEINKLREMVVWIKIMYYHLRRGGKQMVFEVEIRG